MDVFSLSLIIGALTVSLFLLYKFCENRGKKFPPGPAGMSALLCLLRSLKDSSLHKQAKIWRDHYGELVLCRTALTDICFLNSARLVREVFAGKERENFTNGRPQTFSGWFVFNDYRDVSTADDVRQPDWPKRRKLFHFAIKYYGDGVDRFESTVQAELLRLTSRLEASVGEEVVMDGLLRYSLLSIVHALLTGECPEEGSTTVDAMYQADLALNLLMTPTTDMVLTAFPFLRFVPGTSYREICRSLTQGKERMLAELFTKVKETHRPAQPRGIVDVMLDEQLKEENPWLTDDIVKEIMFNIIAGGFVTSHATMKALFLFLTHQPEVAHRIQKEVDDVIGQRMPRVSDRSKLPYTEAVVMETLRLSSILPLGLPHELSADVIIDGYTVPKGSMAYSSVWTIHRDPEVFPDADLFRPERFLDDVTGELLPVTHPARQSFLGFGIGKRSCPGENFARTRIFLYLTTLLQKFDILPPVKHMIQTPQPECYEQGIVLRPKPYHLIFRRRQ